MPIFHSSYEACLVQLHEPYILDIADVGYCTNILNSFEHRDVLLEVEATVLFILYNNSVGNRTRVEFNTIPIDTKNDTRTISAFDMHRGFQCLHK